MNNLQIKFVNPSRFLWAMVMCIFMLLLSSYAHAARPHQTSKKAPVAVHSVAKSSSKRKRTPVKKNAHQSASSQTHHYQSRSVKKVPIGRNPFRQSDLPDLQITDGMHPRITPIQKTKLKIAKTKVVSNLMKQLGKPYRYGGTSPRTGFDCSGLVNYAYRDQLKSTLPRTADNMFHMSSSQSREIDKEELNTGDLVFFSTHSRGHSHADHVGVYLGDGEFIQAPRTGKDIQISRLDDDYWQNHYIGARRVLLPHAVR
ncbi:endopeptidase [Pragia fontium]|uniref:Endopeptidase n=1 Tax=Pragia fontium TaxID=82985 RepID=A0ABQ5LIW0_9GAMM|nr:C40 family peptidase [Pragia fontium]GKX62767.1 endopeptidase [Pragia fontium]